MPRFVATITALAAATRGHLDEAVIGLYYQALADIPIQLLDVAAVELAKGTTFMPAPAEWRKACDQVLERTPPRHPELPPPPNDYTPFCAECDDTGWVHFPQTCEKRTCGRDGPHDHTMVSRCSNPGCLERRRQKLEERRRYYRELR
jgi:hypothetical protein